MVRTCLVVDDSRVVHKVARRILEAHGYAVSEADDFGRLDESLLHHEDERGPAGDELHFVAVFFQGS